MMKTNNKKKGNTAKKLIPAAMMLAVSASMLATSTYAWFTMNTTVTVTGMTLKTTVSSNLLVSPDTNEANFQPTLVQTRSAMLEPVSTINGIQYDYTLNAAASGAALSNATFAAYNENADLTATDTYANKAKYSSAFNTAYGITGANPATAAAYATAYGYVDYAFYLKATNTDSDDNAIVMNKCNLLYQGSEVTEKAWRAAMFVEDLGTSCITGTNPSWDSSANNGAGGAAGAGLVTILAPSGAANQSVNDTTSKNQARNASDALADVDYGDDAVVEDAISEGVTNYYYVVVRVWLEGEDTTCNSETYATLTDEWSLEVGFDMAANPTAVTIIDSDDGN